MVGQGFNPCPSPPCRFPPACPHPPVSPWGCRWSSCSCSCCPCSCSCSCCCCSSPAARGCGCATDAGTCSDSGCGSGCGCAACSAGAAMRAVGDCHRRGHHTPSAAKAIAASPLRRSLSRPARRRQSRALCRGAPSRHGPSPVREGLVRPRAAWGDRAPPQRHGRTVHGAPCLVGQVVAAAAAAGVAFVCW